MISDRALVQAREVAKELVGASVDVNQLAGGGRNSRIYKVQSKDRGFALKQYPARVGNSCDRLFTEVNALRLMERYHVSAVPRVVGVDSHRGYALLSWIDGLAVSQPTDDDIDMALSFLEEIHALRTVLAAAEQPLATEACLAGVEICRQIDARLARLETLSGEKDLLAFLEDRFRPMWHQAVAQAKDETKSAGIDFYTELPPERRSLVPSDFGFHNCLRRPDGTLAFVDFEYFGWDDPVKLTADTLLHPGVSLGAPQSERFRQGATRLYGHDRAFERRLSAYLPLFALRWALIILNEFIPDHWQRRVISGAAEGWNDAKIRQLAKARGMLASVSQKMGGRHDEQ